MRLRYNDMLSVSVRLRYGDGAYVVLMCLFDKLELSQDSTCELDYNALALEFGSSPQLVKSVVEEFGIFVIEDERFYYRELKEYRDKISETKKKAAHARWKNAGVDKKDSNESTENTNVCNIGADALQNNTGASNGKKVPPIPLSKNNIYSQKISDDIFEGLNTRVEEKSVIIEPPKKAKEKKDKTIVSKCREVFESVYADLYGESYYWEGKDGSAMSALIRKIKNSREKRKVPLPTDDESIMDALRKFLYSIESGWIMNNFSVTVINSKYNDIISGIKNNQKKVKNEKTGDKYDDRRGTDAALVRDASRFTTRWVQPSADKRTGS